MSVQEEITAVKFILACFYDQPDNEVQRNELIKTKVEENTWVKTYANFSVPELKEQLRGLQSQLLAGK